MKWSVFQNILSCNYPSKYVLKDFPGLLEMEKRNLLENQKFVEKRWSKYVFTTFSSPYFFFIYSRSFIRMVEFSFLNLLQRKKNCNYSFTYQSRVKTFALEYLVKNSSPIFFSPQKLESRFVVCTSTNLLHDSIFLYYLIRVYSAFLCGVYIYSYLSLSLSVPRPQFSLLKNMQICYHIYGRCRKFES